LSGEQQRRRGTALRHFVVPATKERGLRTRGGFLPIDDLERFFDLNDISYSSAAGKSILSLYPFPNNPAGPFGEHNYSQARPLQADSGAFSAKVDWFQSANHSLTARYNYTEDDSRIPF